MPEALLQQIKSLRPADVASYLKATGWEFDQAWRAESEVWAKADREVVLPTAPEVADYASVLRDLLQDLTRVELRSLDSICHDISAQSLDSVRLRFQSEQSQDGTIPVLKGMHLFQTARNLLVAAALSTHKPQLVLSKRWPHQVQSFLSTARFGQTESGSYGARLLWPVPPPGPAEQEVEEPFERRVTHQFHRAASFGTRVVRQSDPELGAEAAQVGLSANFCESLGAFFDDEIGGSLHFTFAWAPVRPAPRLGPAVVFRADDAPALRSFARSLRQHADEPEFRLVGNIVRLDKEPTDRLGEVTVQAVIHGRVRPVLVSLESDDYFAAAQAHTDQRWMNCRGDLVRDGRSLQLKRVRDIRFESGED